MPDFGAATYRLMLDATRYRAGLYDAERASRTFSRNVSREMQRVSYSMQRLGRDMSLLVTGPLALAAKESYRVMSEFQTSVRRAAGLAELGSRNLDKVEKRVSHVSRAILKMSKTFGVGAREAADGLYFISSAGFKARESLEILRESLKGAAAGMGEAKQVADAVTSAINAYGRENITAKGAVDALTAAVRYGKGEADAMAKVIGVVIAVAQKAKVEFNEVAAAIAVQTRLGIPAARAATSLRSIFGRFEDPTEEVKDALKKMNLNARQVRNRMAADFDETMRFLARRMTEAGVRPAEIFDSIRAQPAFDAITGASQDLNKTVFDGVKAAEQGRDAYQKFGGAAAFAFKQAQKSAEFATKKMQASLEAAQIRLGEFLQPIVKPAAERISRLADAFSSLTDAQGEMIIKFGALVAAAGPGLLILSQLLNWAIIAMTPLGAVSVVIAGIGASIAAAASQSPKMVRELKKMGSEIGDSVEPAMRKFKELGSTVFEEMVLLGREVFPHVKDLIGSIAETASALMDSIGPVVRELAELGREVLPVLLNVAEDVLGVLADLVSLIGGEWIGTVAKFAAGWWLVSKAMGAVAIVSRRLTGLGNMPFFGGPGAPPPGAVGPVVGPGGGVGGSPIVPGWGPTSSYFLNSRPGAAGTYAPTPTNFIGPQTMLGSRGGVRGYRTPAGTAPYSAFGGGLRQTVMPGMMTSAAANSLFAIKNSQFFGPKTSPGFKAGVNPMAGVGLQGQIEKAFTGKNGKFSFGMGKVGTAVTGGLAGLGGAIGSAGQATWAFAKANAVLAGIATIIGLWSNYRGHLQELEILQEQVGDSLKTGGLAMSDVRSQMMTLQQETDASLGDAFNAAITNPIESLLSEIPGVPIRSQFEKSEDKLRVLNEQLTAYTSYATELISGQIPLGGKLTPEKRRLFKFKEQVSGDFLGGDITLTEATDVMGAVQHFRELNGGLGDLSLQAINTWRDAGKLESALGYVQEATAEAARTLENDMTAALKKAITPMSDFRTITEDWVRIALKAEGLSTPQRKDVANIGLALDHAGVLNDGRKARLQSLAETGQFRKYVQLAARFLSGGIKGHKGDPRAEDNLGSFRKQWKGIKLPGVQATIHDAILEGFGLGKGKEGGGSSIAKSGLWKGLGELKNEFPAQFSKVFKKKQTQRKLAKGLLEAFKTSGVDIGTHVLADIQSALAANKTGKALKLAMGVDSKPAMAAIEDFKKSLSKQQVDVLVEATRGGGGGGGGHKHHGGGMIRGGTAMDVPATLQEGEFVVKRQATKKWRPLLEKLNKYHEGGLVANYNLNNLGDAIRGRVARATGKLKGGGGGSTTGKVGKFLELLHEDIGTSNEHLHIAKQNGVVGIAKMLERKFGLVASQHPAFGPVGTHTTNSWHYKNKAVDMNFYPKGAKETSVLRRAYNFLKGGASGGGGGKGAASVGNAGGWLVRALVSGLGAGSGDGKLGPVQVPENTSGAVRKAISMGKQMAASRYGWKGDQWRALYNLWQNESGWRWWADNPTSSAYGIPQSLPGEKMASHGKDWKTNPRTQISWGLDYIKNRQDYGNPMAAWSLWNQRSPHWYKRGGVGLKPHMGVLAEAGREVVLPLDSQVGQRAISKAFGDNEKFATAIGRAMAREMPQNGGGTDTIVLQVDGYELGRVQRKRNTLHGRG